MPPTSLDDLNLIIVTSYPVMSTNAMQTKNHLQTLEEVLGEKEFLHLVLLLQNKLVINVFNQVYLAMVVVLAVRYQPRSN
jgi:hypothetical protein